LHTNTHGHWTVWSLAFCSLAPSTNVITYLAFELDVYGATDETHITVWR